MAVLMASQTRSVFNASKRVLPGRISAAMAADCVMPLHPITSISASWMMPSLIFRDNLQAPCFNPQVPTLWLKPEISSTRLTCVNSPS